jgi:hypothetical protein
MYEQNQEAHNGATLVMNTIDVNNYKRSVEQLLWMEKELTKSDGDAKYASVAERMANNE